MKKRIIAMLLVTGMSTSLGFLAAAVNETGTEPAGVEAVETPTEQTEQTPTETLPTEPVGDTVMAGARSDGTTSDVTVPTPPEDSEPIAPIEVPVGEEITSIAFDQVAATVLAGNLNILAVNEGLVSLESFNREDAYDQLLEAYNSLTDAIWGLSQMPGQQGTAMMLQQQQNSLDAQLEALKEDEYELTYADSKRQIEAAMDQIVTMCESLYIGIVTMEQQLGEGQRGLTGLDRTVKEMDKRYQLGQVSELDLLNLKNTRATTASQLDSLAFQIKSSKVSLQTMLGSEPTGNLAVAALPTVSAGQISNRVPANDLGSGMSASISIYQAKREMDKAKETLDDLKTGGNTKRTAQHTYQSKVYAYQAACQSFKMTFETLSRTLPEQQRLVTVAQNALSVEQRNYDADTLRYQQGSMSENEYQTAADDLAAARVAVTTAQNNLFTTYNQYNWAKRGVIAG